MHSKFLDVRVNWEDIETSTQDSELPFLPILLKMLDMTHKSSLRLYPGFQSTCLQHNLEARVAVMAWEWDRMSAPEKAEALEKLMVAAKEM